MKLPDSYASPIPKRVDKRTFQKQMVREDWTFLRRMMLHVHPMEKGDVKRQYRIEFVKAYNAEPILQKRPNAGRRAANLYLTKQYEDKSKCYE